MLTCVIYIKNWVWCRTCDKEFGCLTLTLPHSHHGAGQVVHRHACACVTKWDMLNSHRDHTVQ